MMKTSRFEDSIEILTTAISSHCVIDVNTPIGLRQESVWGYRMVTRTDCQDDDEWRASVRTLFNKLHLANEKRKSSDMVEKLKNQNITVLDVYPKVFSSTKFVIGLDANADCFLKRPGRDDGIDSSIHEESITNLKEFKRFCNKLSEEEYSPSTDEMTVFKFYLTRILRMDHLIGFESAVKTISYLQKYGKPEMCKYETNLYRILLKDASEITQLISEQSWSVSIPNSAEPQILFEVTAKKPLAEPDYQDPYHEQYWTDEWAADEFEAYQPEDFEPLEIEEVMEMES